MSRYVVKGCHGLQYCLPPNLHVLDAARLWKRCWNELEPSTIVSCWEQACCLPRPSAGTVLAENLDLNKSASEAVLKQMCAQLSSLDVHHKGTADVLQYPGLLEVSYAEAILKQWIQSEEDPEVVAYATVDIFDKLSAGLDTMATASRQHQERPPGTTGLGGGAEEEGAGLEVKDGAAAIPEEQKRVMLDGIVSAVHNAHALAGKLDDQELLDKCMELWSLAHNAIKRIAS